MRPKVLIGALLILTGFAGSSLAAEPWMAPLVNECTGAPAAPSGEADAGALQTVLDQAIYQSGQACSTVADCPCKYQPACFCVSFGCLCNYNICCPEGECS